MLVTYAHLFANDEELAERASSFSARVRDVSQQLATTTMRTAPSPINQTVTYDTSFHLMYNLLQPERSQRVLREKLDHVKETGAAILATGNPGCQMHIGAGACLSGMSLRVCHPIEIVDQAYKAAGYYDFNADLDPIDRRSESV